MTLRFLGLLLTSSLLFGATGSARPKVVAYVPNWIDLPAFAEKIEYRKVTHLNVAFENPTNAEGDLSFSRGDEALIKRAHAEGVQVFVSIGGGSASGDRVLKQRYSALLKEGPREIFVQKLVDYLKAHDFDGLDVDIEGPSITADYAGFIRVLDGPLHSAGKSLTAALSRGYGGDRVADDVFTHLDWVNIMAYDGAGYWEPKAPGQHSSLKFARENTDYWIGRGLPKEKAILGVPFYGYGFGEAFRKRDYPYVDILATHPGAEETDQTGNTIWYNGIPTIRAKTRYALEQGLGGIMIWSLDSDATGEKSLLRAIDNEMAAAAKAEPPPKTDGAAAQ